MSDEKCYIAPARRKSAVERTKREDGGDSGHAVYKERGDSLSVAVYPRQIRVKNTIRNED